MRSKIDITVVVPLYNEEHNLEAFFAELKDAMTAYGKPFEIVFINDGSTDNSEELLLSIAKQTNYVKVIGLRKNAGKARALEQGFKLASGDKVVIMDSDLQYDPRDIKNLANKVEDGYDVVSGRRVNRSDHKNVMVTSWLFRLIVKRLCGLSFFDYFSGLKCFKSNVITSLGFYGDLNRIFSVYAHRVGFKVCEIPINHRPRLHGKSRYTFLSRLKLAINDLIILFYSVTIGQENLYKLGLLGLIILNCGLLMFVASILLFSDLLIKEFFEMLVVQTSIIFIYVGFQLMIFEAVGNVMFGRFDRGYATWNKNVKEVYNADPASPPEG